MTTHHTILGLDHFVFINTHIGLDLYWPKHKSIEGLYLLQIHVYHLRTAQTF